MSRAAKLGFGLAALILILDQLTKWYFFAVVDLPRVGQIRLLPFFNLTVVWNQGVSFGLLGNGAEWGRIALIIFALAVSTLVATWLIKAERLWPAIGMGLIIGGALGNVIDRIIHGRVFDFLDFSGLGFPWVFNVADSAITVGVIMLAWDTFFANREHVPR
jgi:signal peptidase II